MGLKGKTDRHSHVSEERTKGDRKMRQKHQHHLTGFMSVWREKDESEHIKMQSDTDDW